MVSMDEEILGMWKPNGTFFGWDKAQDETRDDTRMPGRLGGWGGLHFM